MIGIIYVSIAKHLMTKEELLDLLDQCTRNNRELQITGMLLYRNGRFMQILEGPDRAVWNVFRSISKDKRHHSVIKLVDRPVKERLFAEWTMGFRNLDEIRADSFPGFSGFPGEEPVGQIFPLDADRANKLLTILR